MRVFLVLLSVVLVAGSLGCSVVRRPARLVAELVERALVGPEGPTVTKVPSEHVHNQRQQHDLENRQLVEDIDTWWMADRPSRLSKWEVR